MKKTACSASGYEQHGDLLLWLLTFLLNVNPTSSEKNTSFRTLFFSINEPLTRELSSLPYIFFYTALFTSDFFNINFSYICHDIQLAIILVQMLFDQHKIFLTFTDLLGTRHKWASVSASSVNMKAQLSADSSCLCQIVFLNARENDL